ncbi:hypothetical protein ACFLT8_04795 [Chloroflexota bacterium]
MPVRYSWSDEYWRKLDKETAKKIRTTCPRCGSSNTYYSGKFQTWRCGKCEYSFAVEGLANSAPWWKRLFGKGR